jgi:MoaD family protein
MIRIKVKFFGPFRDLFGGREREIDLPADFHIRGLLRRLSDTPERDKQLFAAADDLQPYVVVMKNGTPVHGQDGLESLLQDGDIIAVFPFLGGG